MYQWTVVGSLSRLWFLCISLKKNKRRGCDLWVWLLKWLLAPCLNWAKTRTRSQTLNFYFLTPVHWIFRIPIAPDFEVESGKWACGHSKSQTQWSQPRLLFFFKLMHKNQSRLSDRSATSSIPSAGRAPQCPGLSKTQHIRVGLRLLIVIQIFLTLMHSLKSTQTLTLTKNFD